jgi:hypothetical protein
MRLHYYAIHRIVIKQYIGEPAVVCLMKTHSRLESCDFLCCCRCVRLTRLLKRRNIAAELIIREEFAVSECFTIFIPS